MRVKLNVEELYGRIVPACICDVPEIHPECEVHSPAEPRAEKFIEITANPTVGIPADRDLIFTANLKSSATSIHCVPVNLKGGMTAEQVRDAIDTKLRAEGYTVQKIGTDKLDVFWFTQGTLKVYIVSGSWTLTEGGGVPNAGLWLPTVQELFYTQSTLPPDGGE